MRTKKRPEPLAQPEPQPMEHTTILTLESQPVKSRLKEYREAHGATPADIIAIIQTKFPKYDKTLQSKCENTDKYAVELCPEAFNLLLKHYRQKKDTHKRRKSVKCRLTEEDYKAFKEAIELSKYSTIQAYLERSIKRFTNRMRRKEEPND